MKRTESSYIQIGEMGQSIVLAIQGGGPDLVTQHTHKKPGMVTYICNSGAVEAEVGELLEIIQPSSMFSEHACLKNNTKSG